MANLPTFTAPIAQALYPIGVEPVVTDLLTTGAPVAFSTSGGKDSGAMALATSFYLDEMGHQGPRLLIHADLGRVEWRESLPMCQRLADRLDLPLVVVRRQAGDLLDRWRVRWYVIYNQASLQKMHDGHSNSLCLPGQNLDIICTRTIKIKSKKGCVEVEDVRWELYPLVATSELARAWLQMQAHLQLAPKTIDAYGR